MARRKPGQPEQPYLVTDDEEQDEPYLVTDDFADVRSSASTTARSGVGDIDLGSPTRRAPAGTPAPRRDTMPAPGQMTRDLLGRGTQQPLPTFARRPGQPAPAAPRAPGPKLPPPVVADAASTRRPTRGLVRARGAAPDTRAVNPALDVFGGDGVKLHTMVEPELGTRGYRDPMATAQVRAEARRVAEGRVTINPATGEPYTPEERERAAFVDQNLGAREAAEESKGGLGRRTLDALAFGRVNGEAYTAISDAARRGDLVTDADVNELGLTTRSGERVRTEPTTMESVREEMAPAALGQLPYLALGPEGAIMRGLASRATARGIPSLGRVLGTAAGPRGIGEALVPGAVAEATTAAGRAGQRAITGALQGAPTGFAMDVVTERNRGATIGEALLAGTAGAVMGAGLGAPLEIGLGAAGDVIGAGWRATRAAVNARRGGPPTEGAPELAEDAPELRPDAPPVPGQEAAREAQLGGIAEVLERLHTQRREEYPRMVEELVEGSPLHRPAGPEWWNEALPPEPEAAAPVAPSRIEVPPSYGPPRSREVIGAEPEPVEPPVARPMRTARDAAAARYPTPPEPAELDALGEVDAARQLERMQAQERVDAEIAQRQADEARLAAARPPAGPLTLAQTMARRARDPNFALGAAATAAGAGVLGDEEEAGALGATLALAVPQRSRASIVNAIGKLESEWAGRGLAGEPQYRIDSWAGVLEEMGADEAAAEVVDSRLRAAAGNGSRDFSDDTLIPLSRVREIIAQERVGEGPSQRFYSRLTKAVESLPNAFDKPRTAREWMEKLGATTTFNRREYEKFLKPWLEQQPRDVKLTRGDVLDQLDANGLRLEERRLQSPEGSAMSSDDDGLLEEAADDIADADVGPALEARRERVREIEEERETELNTAREYYEREDRRADAYWRDVETALAGVEDQSGALERAQQTLDRYYDRNDDGEGVDPREATDEVMQALSEDGYLSGGAADPTLPDDFRVEEDENGEWSVYRESDDELVSGPFASRIQALDVGERDGHYDLGGTDHPLPSGAEPARVAARTIAEAELRGYAGQPAGSPIQYRAELWAGGRRNAILGHADTAEELEAKIAEMRDDPARGVWFEGGADVRIASPEQQIEEQAARIGGGDPDAEVNVVWNPATGYVWGHSMYGSLDDFADDFVRDRWEPAQAADFGQVESEVYAYVEQRNRAAEAFREFSSLESNYEYGDGDPDWDRGRQYTRFTDEIEALERRVPDYEAARARMAAAGAEVPEGAPIALPPVVKGKAEFSTYQRIGGGTNYRELLNVWVRPTEPGTTGYAAGEQMNSDHWARYGHYDAAGHLRVEDHMVRAGFEPDNVEQMIEEAFKLPDDPEKAAYERTVGGDATYAAAVRSLNRWRETRAKVRKLDDEMRELATRIAEHEDEFNRTGQAPPAAYDLVREYRDKQNTQNNLASQVERDIAEVTRALEEKGVELPKPKRTLVMLESQFDPVQQANKKQRLPSDPPSGPATGPRRGWREKQAPPTKEEEAALAEETALIETEMELWREQARDLIQLVRASVSGVQDAVADHLNTTVPAAVRLPQTPYDYSSGNARDRINATRTYIDALVGEGHMPELLGAELIDELSLSGGHADRAAELTAEANARNVRLTEIRDRVHPIANTSGIADMPWRETEEVVQLNAARLLLEAADGNYERVAWSSAENRYDKAGLKMIAAKSTYEVHTPKALRKLFASLGFKDVKIEHIRIGGYGHFAFDLTPEMRAKIKQMGMPLLTALGMVGISSSSAQAQGERTGPSERSDAMSLAAGGALGAGLVYLWKNRGARKLLTENRALARELMMDELTGLANKRALARARDAVDADPNHAWLVFDGDQFKAMNDAHGHDAGDAALAHFGKAIMQAAEQVGVPMRGFRPGGDEFAFAVPKHKAEALLRAVEQASVYARGTGSKRVETRLSGEYADTYEQADTKLAAFKAERRERDPRYRRAVVAGGATVYANPIGPALRMLARYPSAAGIAALGAVAAQEENPDVRRAGVPIMALGALHAIGSARLRAGGAALGMKAVAALRKTDAGTAAVRATVPSALLPKGVQKAIVEYEQRVARREARATEHAAKARALGPEGDRAVSDVIEGEDWEDTSGMDPKLVTEVLRVASEIAQERDALQVDLDVSGVLPRSGQLPNWLPRRYAHYDALDAVDATGRGGRSSRLPRTTPATKSRTLDAPLREAMDMIRAAQAAGDAQAEQAARDLYDARYVDHLAQRHALGEIREASYRVQRGFSENGRKVEAAWLLGKLRSIPGTLHPEYEKSLDDFLAAKQLFQTATNKADRDQARALMDAEYVKMDELTRKFRSRNEGEWRTLPDTKGLGPLRGAIVQRDVANELTGIVDQRARTAFLQWWKRSKTVYNLGSHLGNFASNISVAHMSGMPLHMIPVHFAKAVADMKKYGAATRALAEAGVLNHNAVTADGAGALDGLDPYGEEGLAELAETTRPNTAASIRDAGVRPARTLRQNERLRGAATAGAIGALLGADEENPERAALWGAAGAGLGMAMARKGARGVQQLYNNEDNVFRVAYYLHRRSIGDTAQQAMERARDDFGNFRTRSPALSVVRGNLSPFILYSAKMLPTFARHMVDRPWRYLALVALWGGADMMGEEAAGDVPESDIPVRERRPLGYFLPGATATGDVNEMGERARFDVARYTPLSALTTGAPPGSAATAALGDRFPGALSASSPYIDAAVRFVGNRDPFTGRDVFMRDYPKDENIAEALNQAGAILAPSAIGVHGKRVEESYDNRDMDKLASDAMGPLGLRPRYVRPGANVRSASWQLRQAMMNIQRDLEREAIANRDESRGGVIGRRLQRRIQSAIDAYIERVGSPPPPELMEELGVPADLATPASPTR